MFLAACVDAGVPGEAIQEVPRYLGLRGVEVRFFEDRRCGLRGLRCEVLEDGAPTESPPVDDHDHDHEELPPHAHPPGETHGHRGHHGHHDHSHGSDGSRSEPSCRGLSEIRSMIDKSGLEVDVRERATAMFVRLAEVEAAAHGVALDDVHFHEVGAVDSLVDIVGAALAWSLLRPSSASVSDVVVGSGRVRTAHGVMPVPAPATAAILHGKRCVWEGRGELLTPTGALILENMFPSWGADPERTASGGVLQRVGVGLGRRELQDRCNACRLMVRQTRGGDDGAPESDELTWETIDIVQTQVDDVSPEQIAHALARLGANDSVRDVFSQPISMKKGRPGVLITVHCAQDSAMEAVRILARETGTLGCRVEQSRRWVAGRDVVEVETAFGRLRVKVGRLGEEVISVAPESDDCRSAAQEHRTTWRRVYDAAHAAALSALRDERARD